MKVITSSSVIGSGGESLFKRCDRIALESMAMNTRRITMAVSNQIIPMDTASGRVLQAVFGPKNGVQTYLGPTSTSKALMLKLKVKGKRIYIKLTFDEVFEGSLQNPEDHEGIYGSYRAYRTQPNTRVASIVYPEDQMDEACRSTLAVCGGRVEITPDLCLTSENGCYKKNPHPEYGPSWQKSRGAEKRYMPSAMPKESHYFDYVSRGRYVPDGKTEV